MSETDKIATQSLEEDVQAAIEPKSDVNALASNLDNTQLGENSEGKGDEKPSVTS